MSLFNSGIRPVIDQWLLDEARAKMRANHWSIKRSWIPRERNEHGHFI